MVILMLLGILTLTAMAALILLKPDTTENFTAGFFCGIGIGVSLGMVIRAGSSTGGCDVPTILISRIFRLPLGGVVYVFDMAVLAMQLMFSDGEGILYGIFMAFVIHTSSRFHKSNKKH